MFNAHVESDADIPQRQKAVNVILNKIRTINTENFPVIITGDHNDKESDLVAYRNSEFTSARANAPLTDDGETLNGFGEAISSDKVIDHVYTKGCTVNSFHVDRCVRALPYPSITDGTISSRTSPTPPTV